MVFKDFLARDAIRTAYESLIRSIVGGDPTVRKTRQPERETKREVTENLVP